MQTVSRNLCPQLRRQFSLLIISTKCEDRVRSNTMRNIHISLQANRNHRILLRGFRLCRQLSTSSSALPSELRNHPVNSNTEQSISQELASTIYAALNLGSITAKEAEAALRSSGFHSDVIRRRADLKFPSARTARRYIFRAARIHPSHSIARRSPHRTAYARPFPHPPRAASRFPTPRRPLPATPPPPPLRRSRWPCSTRRCGGTGWRRRTGAGAGPGAGGRRSTGWSRWWTCWKGAPRCTSTGAPPVPAARCGWIPHPLARS